MNSEDNKMLVFTFIGGFAIFAMLIVSALIVKADVWKEQLHWESLRQIDPSEEVTLDELITILEQARPHVWEQTGIMGDCRWNTLVYDPCTANPICMAQREVDKMRERKALAERIDEVVRILREANK